MEHKTGIGLDISDDRICAVELAVTDNGIKVVRSETIPAPEGSISGGVIVNPPAVTKALKTLFRTRDFGAAKTNVAVSISGVASVTRVTQLPVGDPTAMKEQLLHEVRNYAFLMGQEPAIDYTALWGAPSVKDEKQILLTAAIEDNVNTLADAVTKARVELSAIVPSPLACIKAANFKSAATPAAAIFAVIETKAWHIIVIQGGTIRFLKTAPAPDEVSAGLTGAVLQNLSSQIKSVFDFYDTSIGNVKDIHKVHVCSDIDLNSSFPAELSRALQHPGIAVETCTPSSILKGAGLLNDGKGKPTPCAVGLALMAIGYADKLEKLNLLPDALKHARETKHKILFTVMLFVGMISCVFMATIGVRFYLSSLGRELSGLQEEVKKFTFEDVVAESASISEELNRRGVILASDWQPIPWNELFEEIRRRIPQDMRLTSLKADQNGGILLEGESANILSVYRYLNLLTESKLIGSAKVDFVKSNEISKTALIKYKIECRLRKLQEKQQ